MSGNELTDLLDTAGRALGGDAQADPVKLMARARRHGRRQRLVGLTGVLALVLVAAAAGLPSLRNRQDDTLDVAAGRADEFPPGWSQLPDPPLSPRTEATAATIGDEIVVAGGTTRSCQPPVSCPGVEERQGLADGAAFNLRTRTWRPIAPAPVGFVGARAIVLDGAMVLSACGQAICDSGGYSFIRLSTLLRYQPAGDRWDVMESPPTSGSYQLATLGHELVAYVPSGGDPPERADWRLETTTGAWRQLPPDALPPLNLRQMMSDGRGLMLFGIEGSLDGNAPGTLVGARLDAATQTWIRLPPIPAFRNFRAFVLEGLMIVLNPQADSVTGATIDPPTGRWSPVEASPGGASLAGVVGADDSQYTAVRGWMLDLVTRTWIAPPLVEVRAAAVTSFGRRLFRFGGETSSGQSGPDLLGEAWVWTPPLAAPPETTKKLPVDTKNSPAASP